MRRAIRTTLLALSLLAGSAGAVAAGPFNNGFDLSGALIPAQEVFSGGPPRDGIPALDAPRFLRPQDAASLREGDRVLGVHRNGVTKAYPIAILNWHEIVNDDFAGEAVTVSYCPLCGSGIAYRASVDGRRLTFGVSGLLYNSDLLLYDRQTESLWSQILSRAVSGPLRGTRMETIPINDTSWGEWRARHPDTLVLSEQTGHVRDYRRNPYSGYEESDQIMFPVRFRALGYHPKERVIGVEVGEKHKAYPFVELAKAAHEVHDNVGGRDLVVRFDVQHRTGAVFDAAGHEFPSLTAFWFAWYVFHPDTAVYKATATDR